MIKAFDTFFRVTSALFVARSKEFYRDRGSFLWSIIFPVFIIAAISLAFSGEGREIFRVGIYQGQTTTKIDQPLLSEPYIKTVHYDDFELALQRVRYHQLDLLLSATDPDYYWVNEHSIKGLATERLLLALGGNSLLRKTVTGKQVRYVDWVIPGVLGMNLMFGSLFGIGFVIVRYRKNGVLKRLQVTPVTRLQFHTAQILSRLAVMLVTTFIVYAGCDYFIDFVMLGSYINLILTGVLGILAMISLALIVASRTASEELASGVLNFFTFPMLLLSEVWFSLDDAPSWLHAISQVLPLTHLVQAARAIMIDGAGYADISHHLWILLGMSIVFLGTAALLFEWNEK